MVPTLVPYLLPIRPSIWRKIYKWKNINSNTFKQKLPIPKRKHGDLKTKAGLLLARIQIHQPNYILDLPHGIHDSVVLDKDPDPYSLISLFMAKNNSLKTLLGMPQMLCRFVSTGTFLFSTVTVSQKFPWEWEQVTPVRLVRWCWPWPGAGPTSWLGQLAGSFPI